MTGRDLIMYILNNKLEDEPIVQNGKLIGFLTVEEAAVKHNVGTATVLTWFQMGTIEGIEIGNTILILSNANPEIK